MSDSKKNDPRKIDIAKQAQGEDASQNPPPISPENMGDAEAGPLVPVGNQSVIQDPDLAWIDATDSLRKNFIRSLQDYKMTWGQKRALDRERERMIREVTQQYVDYLSGEAELATKAALSARDSVLRQELAKLRAKLFVELAGIAGIGVTEIERIAQSYSAQITSPAIRQKYADFIMKKILELLEYPKE